MAQRLELLQQQIGSPKAAFVESSFDYLNLSSMLTKEENDVRLKVRAWGEKEVLPHMTPFIEEAKFPESIMNKMKELNIFEHFLKPPYGKPISTSGMGMIMAELARADASVATAVTVTWGLAMFTIEALGSEEQKAKYLPKMKALEWLGGWGLTEEKVGSDASNLQTTVTKTHEGYRLNGNKRWIGNGNRDVLVIWARNTENNKVEGYVMETSTPGITTTVIKNKMALRPVQNCNIYLNNVLLTEANKLPKATDFAKGTGLILKHSRVFVCWIAVGIAMGSYDHAIRYTTSRKQFGQPIAGFQMIQEKLVKMMSNIQASLLSCFRISQLIDQNRATMGQIAMCKAFVTSSARDVVKWGREVFGGNGIIHEHYAMKAMMDLEAVYTYEGTYDINTLVAGRELTGLSAFKGGKN